MHKNCASSFELCALKSILIEITAKHEIEYQSTKYEIQSTKYKIQSTKLTTCGKKQMKAAEQQATNTLRGTLLLRMARLSDSRKAPRRIIQFEGSLPSSCKFK
jgi:hypothetical protein